MFETFCDFLCDKTKKFITVEVNPPHGASLDGIIDDIRKHKLHEKVNGFSCTDNPLAKLKMSGVLSAIRLQQTFGKPVIATMSMRDKNKLFCNPHCLVPTTSTYDVFWHLRAIRQNIPTSLR